MPSTTSTAVGDSASPTNASAVSVPRKQTTLAQATPDPNDRHTPNAIKPGTRAPLAAPRPSERVSGCPTNVLRSRSGESGPTDHGARRGQSPCGERNLFPDVDEHLQAV